MCFRYLLFSFRTTAKVKFFQAGDYGSVVDLNCSFLSKDGVSSNIIFSVIDFSSLLTSNTVLKIAYKEFARKMNPMAHDRLINRTRCLTAIGDDVTGCWS